MPGPPGCRLYTPRGLPEPLLVALGLPCSFPGTPLGLPGSSHRRGFCMFAIFCCFDSFSPEVEIIAKREDLADQRWPARDPEGTVSPPLLVF